MRIPLIMAIVAGLMSVVLDLYIFSDLRRNYPGRRWLRTGYAALSVLLWLALVGVVCMPYRSREQDILWIMWSMYSYITVYVAKLVFVVFSLAGLIPALWGGKKLKLGKWVGLPLAVIVFCSLWWGSAVTRHKIQVNNVCVASRRLPAGFDGFRIVQISDLHVGTWGDDTRFISRMVDSVNAQHPDMILFTGDIVNRETAELAPFLATLSRLKAPYGVYSVLGNHDYGDYITWEHEQEKVENMALMRGWQKQIGWRLLDNERRDIVVRGDTIQLLGVENWGEPPFHQYGHLTDAYPISTDSVYHLRDNRFKILMTHNPEHWRREVVDVSNIDLTLSGHTHAMQMVFGIGDFKWSPATFKYNQWGGLYSKRNKYGDNLYIYVNIGAGEVGMPFRIGGAAPEITVITLRRPAKGVATTPEPEIAD